MSSTLSLELLLGALALSVSTLLGVVIIRRDWNSWTHRLFFTLACFINAYLILNFVSLHPPQSTPESQLFWIRMVMFSVSFIGPTLILLVSNFPHRHFVFPVKYLIPLIVLLISTAVASLLPLVFSSISYPMGEPVPVPGPGIVLFVVDFIGLFLLSFVILSIRFRRSTGRDHEMLRYLFWGVLISFSSMAIFAFLFVVVIKTSAFVFLGPIFPVILMTFIAYAIVRYNMFNIRVVATQVFVIAIWVFLFSRLFTLKETIDFLIDGSIFLLTVIAGQWLIRSVKQEIRSREKIEDLVQQLTQANDRLTELDQLKSEFLSFASHQLRSPITAIKGYTSLVLEGSFGKVPKKIGGALDRVFSAANSLAMVVDDFLNISRIEQGRLKINFAPMDVQELLEQIIGEQTPTIESANLKLSTNLTEESTTISGDKDKLRQVFTNLIDNSIKYTPKGGKISIELKLVESKFLFSVSDTGIGIAPGALSRLFGKFERASNAQSQNVKGTGLGLYIAKEIVKAHQGRMWAESPGEGKGSTFFVELPINSA